MIPENIFEVIIYIVAVMIAMSALKHPFVFLASKLKNRRYWKLLASSGIRDIDRMDGYQFEEYLKALFTKLGYKPVVTKKSGDFGADLVLQGRNKIVVQAKRYKKKSNVGLSAVQEIYAAKTYYKADEAWVITNSHYTKSAEELAAACSVKLLNRNALQEFILKVNPDTSAAEIYNTVQPAPRKCPRCKSQMIRRISREGNKFMGCSNFPKCDYSAAINEK